MPLYNYTCGRCGDFRAWQPMTQAAEAGECPACGRPAPRAVAAPFIASMNPNTRIAHQRNEKSAHEPQVMSRGQLERSGTKRCSHDGDGKTHRHVHQSSRPWMIGH